MLSRLILCLLKVEISFKVPTHISDLKLLYIHTNKLIKFRAINTEINNLNLFKRWLKTYSQSS